MDGLALSVSLLLFILVVIYMSQTNGLSRRVRELEEEMGRLRLAQGASPSRPSSAVNGPLLPKTSPVPTRAPRPSPVGMASAVSEAVDLPLAAAVSDLAAEVSVGKLPRHRAAWRPLWEQVRGNEEWEALIGTRWMNRLGAVALILGIGFFLKYAFDKQWISPSLRVVIGLVIGTGLLALAHRCQSRGYRVFAQGLVGTGLAALYLSVYASHNFFHLVAEPVALAGMGVVTAIALAQALYYDSLATAILAWIGGFLTIPLLGITSGDMVGVVGYVTLLDTAMLGIVYARDRWFVLEPLTMAATYLTFVGWYVSQYRSSQLLLAATALTLFWALFYGLDVTRVVRGTPTYRGLRDMLGAGNALVYYAVLFALLRDHMFDLGLVTLGLGIVYLATVLLARRRLQDGDRIDARFTLTAIILGIAASPILTSGFPTAILWSIEVAALLWCGLRFRLSYIWQPAIVLYALAYAYLLGTTGSVAYTPLHTFRPILNERALAFLLLSLSYAAGALLLRSYAGKGRVRLMASLQYGCCSLILILLTIEVSDYYRRAALDASSVQVEHLQFTRLLVLAAVWMLYSLPLVWLGLKRDIFPVLSSGMAVLALAVGLAVGVGISYRPIADFTPVFNIRFGILAIILVSLLLQARWLRSRTGSYPWMPTAVVMYRAAMVLLGFELLSSEIHDYFRYQAGGVSEQAGASGYFVELMTLAAIWMLYSFPLVRYGIRNRALSILLLGLGTVAAATGAGAIASVAFEPTRWLSLALTLRPIVLALLGIGLFVHMRWVRESLKAYVWLDTVLLALQACTVLLGLEMITTQTHDVFQYHITTSHARGLSGTGLQNLEQLTLSVLWLLYAMVLMGIGLWRRTRWLRIGAMALLAFIVLKIFIYDLSFLNPGYRSISFAGLGIILLGMSYLYQRYRGLLLEAA